MAEAFRDREKWLALKELTLDGEDILKDQRLVALIRDFNQQGTTFNVSQYKVKDY